MKQSIPLPPHHCIAQLSITTAELLLTVYSRYPRVHWVGSGSGRCMVYSDLRTSSLRQGNWLAVTRLFPPLYWIPSPIPLQSFSHWRESKHYVLIKETARFIHASTWVVQICFILLGTILISYWQFRHKLLGSSHLNFPSPDFPFIWLSLFNGSPR